MSLPRSIDRTDLSGATVTVTTTAETLVLVGPSLQTPKDSGFVVTLVSLTMTTGGSTTALTGRVRQGSTLSGAVIGQPFALTGFTAGSGVSLTFLVSQPAQTTDYVQNCLTVQQTGAAANGTVNAATILMISF
jgi:hypothetical protein